MKLIAVAATVCAVAACGSDDTSSAPALASLGPAVAAPQPPTAPPVTDGNALRAALLTAGDLPTGFAPLVDPTQDLGLPPAPESDEPDKSRTDPPACSLVLAPVADQQKGAAAQAVSRFGGPNFASIDIDAASYQDVATAFAKVQERFGQCTKYSGTDADGVAVDYRLGGREQSGVGDASTSVRVVTDSSGITLTSDVVVAVVGSTVIQVSATGTDPVDPNVLTGVAVKQVDRLRGKPGT